MKTILMIFIATVLLVACKSKSEDSAPLTQTINTVPTLAENMEGKTYGKYNNGILVSWQVFRKDTMEMYFLDSVHNDTNNLFGGMSSVDDSLFIALAYGHQDGTRQPMSGIIRWKIIFKGDSIFENGYYYGVPKH